jgi:phosphatidylinositol alpha 1,6-mannosyltransferase
MTQLTAHGFERLWLWGRGVDLGCFGPENRCDELRRQLAPGGELLAGYVGRLATEKRVDLLAGVARLPGVRLVVVGGGPAAGGLRERMPTAVFLGEQRGAQLARTYASLDVFVHSGPHETFGQTLQEAAASGVPVVPPVARSIWSIPASPVSWPSRETRRPSPRRWPGWPPTPRCAPRRAGPGGARCRTEAGPRSATS